MTPTNEVQVFAYANATLIIIRLKKITNYLNNFFLSFQSHVCPCIYSYLFEFDTSKKWKSHH